MHLLSDLGAVFTWRGYGTSQEGSAVEFRGVNVVTVEGELISRSELFDEADLDAALARFDELSRPAPRLENTASRVDKRFQACFAARDWDVMAKMLSDGFSIEDRRRVVNMGNLQGRDAELGVHAYAVVGSEHVTSTVIATRAQRLALSHYRFSDSDQRPDAFRIEMLVVVEIDADDRMAAVVVFDADNIDAAIAELDARYAAGEAAAHAHTWSVISGSYAAINRNEMPLTTPDCVNIDRRRELAMGVGDLIAYISAVPDRNQDSKVYVEAVHRLTERGAVVTYAAHGTSQEGFDAEWRGVAVLTVDSELVDRTEIFGEADLDAAIARFEELGRPAPRLENTATCVFERLYAHVAAGEWDAVAQITAENVSVDDRRRVVNAGILHGRDANIKDAQATVGVGFTMTMLGVLATRGERLALTGIRVSGPDPEAIQNDALQIMEIDAEEQIAGVVVFDLEDFDAAIAELDARYLAGEAAAHSQTWLAIAEVYAALNRAEMPTTAPDFVDIDHRSLAAIGSGDLLAYVQAALKDARRHRIYVETVHRLTDLGAVATHLGKATSREGFDAEWRLTGFFIVDGDLINRYEIFDEADLETALARFDELHAQPPRLENTAAQAYEHIQAHFAARDWNGLADALADDVFRDDRRRVVGAELRKGRGPLVAEFSALAEIGVKRLSFDTIAIRGSRLLLSRSRASGHDPRADAFRTDVLTIIELDPDGRIAAIITFDPDDFDAAVAALDARYLAGEAAPHSAVFSAVMQGFVALNRHERFLMTPDVVSVDHRRGRAFVPGDLPAFLDATWELMPQASFYIEDVHRLNDIGVVVAYVVHGSTAEGFGAEWRQVTVLKIAGDCVSRCEFFDEADLDAAIASFDELSRPARRLENAASRVGERYLAHFAAGKWDAMPKILADNFFNDDRRPVVGSGLLVGRDAQEANERAIAELWTTTVTLNIMATRGSRLALARLGFLGRDEGPEAFVTEMLTIVEINADERIVASVSFGVDDFEAAIAELDARYLAGEAADHARTWSVIAKSYASLRRQELPAISPGTVFVDHRRAAAFGASDLSAYIRAGFDLGQNIRPYVQAVHRLSDLGAVCSYAAHGVSHEGFDAEWQGIDLTTVDGDLVNRCEFFDEDDLEAALATFDQLSRPAPRLANTATRTLARVHAYFAARDWAALGSMMAADVVDEDRRRVANAGVRHGRDAVVGGVQAAADLGAQHIASTAIATRGDRLALCRFRYSGRDQRPEAFYSEALGVVEIDGDGRVLGHVAFDLEEIDAAFDELDARYLAGEAAAHARTWSAIARGNAAANQNARLPMTPDSSMIDHRLRTTLTAEDLTAYVRASWDLTPELHMFIESVHRLNDLGTVVTHASHGTSQDDFEAEWRQITLFTVEGDLCNRCEIFDEANLDAALARFAELQTQARRGENAASQVVERFWMNFASRHWDAMAETMAHDFCTHDRRRVANAGVVHGRAAHITNMRAVAEVGFEGLSSTVIATRGQRLALVSFHTSMRGSPPGEVIADVVGIVEIDADNRLVAAVHFDSDDIDAAFEELEARYLVGEGAAHAHAWSVIARTYAAFNRHEFPPTTPDSVYIDHRPLVTNDASDLAANVHATWELMDVSIYIAESVHRLSELGAVVTQTLKGTSKEGLDVEYRMIDILTVEGDLLTRVEVFDEADIETALARFDELQPQAPRLENAASQLEQRFLTYFAARDWDAYAEILSDDVCMDDRRHVVNAGVSYGRDAEIASQRAVADVGVTRFTSTVIAIRGRRLALGCYSVFDGWSGAKVLVVSEINAENRIAARVAFDPEDFDAAFAELDARYLAGEAAAHAHTWSLVMQTQAAWNRHEFVPNTEDWVNIDHRRGRAYEPGELKPFLRASWNVIPDAKLRTEAVHRLTNAGVVSTVVATGTSQEGFDAEWREIALVTFDGDLLSRCELFDEADLDAALARFDELQPQARPLENAASQVEQRFLAYFAARNWVALAEILTDESFIDDRRPVVNAGLWDGRDAVIANLQAVADAAANITSVIAIRGERLALTRIRSTNRDPRQGDFGVEMLNIIEIDTDERIVAHVEFDADDIDAAIAELDARYLAGEAAAYADAWSVMMQACAALNTRQIFATTADFVDIDHRSLAAIASGDLKAYIREALNDGAYIVYIEAVHRLGDLGAVVTLVSRGISQDGFDGEWRMADIFTVDGDLISRCEIFNEADLDAALARFDELQPRARRLENAASQVEQRYLTYFAARDWDAYAEILADDVCVDDRRHVVNAGVRHGRDAEIASMRAIADIGVTQFTKTVIAIRGERLALSSNTVFDGWGGSTMLSVAEINADSQIVAGVVFDADDIDAAFEELDSRYLAGEAGAYAHTWSVIMRFNAAFNRHEIPATDWITIDHRRLITADTSDQSALIQEVWNITPDLSIHIEAVHRLSSVGAVVTRELRGTSQEGFDAEWRMIQLLTVEGDQISRSELFDEADLDAALARFDELQPRAPRLENAASRLIERLLAHFPARHWTAMAELLADDASIYDRRRVVNAENQHGRDVDIANLRAMAELGVTNIACTLIATRGDRLTLARNRMSGRDPRPDAFRTDVLTVVEINADNRIATQVVFDPDDIDAAFEELDARYLAGEAADHAHTWSVMMQTCAAINTREIFPTTADFVDIDHRSFAAIGSGDLKAYIRAALNDGVYNIYIEAAHRLGDLGAVVTLVSRGTSHEGFDGEWRMTDIFTFEGDLLSRCEMFDESDLDAALARFDELDQPSP